MTRVSLIVSPFNLDHGTDHRDQRADLPQGLTRQCPFGGPLQAVVLGATVIVAVVVAVVVGAVVVAAVVVAAVVLAAVVFEATVVGEQ